MKNGHSYHFTLDLIEQEQLSLHSLGKAWQILYQNWLPILKMYLGQFKEQGKQVLYLAINKKNHSYCAYFIYH